MKLPTQEQIADTLGVKQSTVSKYMNGRLSISIFQAIKLKDRYEIPLEAWRDIKKWISHYQSMPDTPVHDQVEDPQKSNLKESA